MLTKTDLIKCYCDNLASELLSRLDNYFSDNLTAEDFTEMLQITSEVLDREYIENKEGNNE